MMGKVVAAALLLFAAASSAQAQATVILAGRVLDPRTGQLHANRRVVVDGGRIVSVDSATTDASATAIDLRGYTLLPGLIDAHVHLAIGGSLRENALTTLRAGFTTVVDLGARTTDVLRLRDSINAGAIEGPRVLAAGIWVGRAGGVCEFRGVGIAPTTDAFRARVRENIEAGADLIKLCLTGWPAAAHARPNDYEIADSIIRAAVDEATSAKRLVVAHDISQGGVDAAVRAGVNGFAHAAFVDQRLARRMRQRGVFLIPTLASLTGNDTTAVGRALVSATQRVYEAGVPIVFGTDAGVVPHGRNAVEFGALRSAGMSRVDAIKAATFGAAQALRIADSIGVVAPGFVADLIAVEGDPTADLSLLSRVQFVMSRGKPILLPRPRTQP